MEMPLPKRLTGFLAFLCIAMGLSTSAETTQHAPVEWHEPIEVASGDGHKGRWKMNRSDYRYVDDPAVAMAPTGETAVVWADQARQDLFLQIYDPKGQPQWETPRNISRSPDVFSWLPRVRVTGKEQLEVHVLWQEIVFSGGSHGGEIFFAKWREGEPSATEPVNISQTRAGAGKGRITEQFWHNGSLSLALGPEDEIYAAWTVHEGGLWFCRSTDGGDSFTEPRRLWGGPENKPARGPDLAVDDDARLYLAWTEGGTASANIHWTTSTDEGEDWTKPRVLADTPGYADAPALAIGPDGTLLAVFSEGPDGPFGPTHLRIACKQPGTPEFDSPERLKDRPDEHFVRAGFPEIEWLPDGRVVILWNLATQNTPRAQALALTLSPDNGQTFQPPVLLPGNTVDRNAFHGSLQGMFMQKLAVSPNGRIAVGDSIFTPDSNSVVQLHLGKLTPPPDSYP